jgi:uncharacterized membrane protein YcaP (DUF421 family)
MDPWRLAVRCLVTYFLLLVLVRVTGKRAVAHSRPVDLVVFLLIGDLIDDALWAEVPFSQFMVAASTIALTTLGLERAEARS